MSAPERDEDVGLAAEYALGVLDSAERASAQRRIAADPGFAAEVRAWEDRLHPLTQAIAVEAPSAGLWPRIAASLPSRAPRAADRQARRPGLWSSLDFWRAATVGMGALAAASLAFAVLKDPERTPPQPPMMIARVGTEAGAPVLVVAYDPTRRTAVVTPLAPAAPTGHAHELWLIDREGRPHSLGVIRMDRAMPHRLPEDMVPMAGEDAMLAVTVEQTGGSPTGAPSGPPVATGALSRV